MRVEVYGRPGCHLCEDAESALRRLQAGHGFELAVFDIEADEALLRRYLERIPVVVVDGEELCEYFLDEAALIALLRRGHLQ